MAPRSTPVLLIEDTPSLARVYAEFLKKESFTVISVETGSDALDQLADGAPKVVLLDLQLPDMNGMEVLRRIAAQALPCAVIVITAHGSVKAAVEAMRYGAYDFLVKPFSADRLLVTVRNAMERLRLAQIVETYERDISRTRYHGFIGSSLAMQAIYRIIDSAASSRATVFITGESGTGKEVCAEAIHRQSPRGSKPFIAINCGAIPKDLMESEIFGHVKGSFTGAVSDREGAAARADGGTLFLDEICELAPDLQTKLLRFIQTGTFTPVGGSKLEKVDLRIICATNRDPLREVEEGRFREDLYYRLHVIPIHLPALREREDDVLEIARHYLTDYAAEEGKGFTHFTAEAEQALRGYHWPGNVRQLQNVVRNIVVLHEGDTVTAAMLPPPLSTGGAGAHGAGPAVPLHHPHALQPGPAPQQAAPAAAPPAPPPQPPGPKPIRPLWEVEKDAIEDAIAACDGNIPRAAALLQISASTIYRKRLTWQAEGKL
ncbi:sigma-54-dependent transcriptional regulator [Azospirillum thermophilum]|uniref:Sigma-54-dependent Fis family transcriptional regulator n=1 Tax=Azospirillum thermophilum TaxID=2202148 RepID=A0A2S2CU96_9PROT|nr:sigma-54 dependent transcriptional regulator [Azospirillum thermophilum]AWK87847.1 sigma-54-dependent Fis family transcriptional regulator [Azospirillum thermophilum]